MCAGLCSVIVRHSLLLVETHCTGVGEKGAARERVGGVLVAHATLEPLAELVRLDEGHRHALADLILFGDLVIFKILVRRGIAGAHGQGGEFERVQVPGVPVLDPIPVLPAVGLLLLLHLARVHGAFIVQIIGNHLGG